MRCNLMKRGHIFAVEPLQETTDEARISVSREIFERDGAPKGADGFEVWEGSRFVYRYPEASQAAH